MAKLLSLSASPPNDSTIGLVLHAEHSFNASTFSARQVASTRAHMYSAVTAALLRDQRHEVEILDDLSTGHRRAVPEGITFHEGSLHDRAMLDAVFARPFDAVVHFAAHSLVGESVSNPLKYWRNNVGGTLALLERVTTGGARRFVFSSTAAVYGEPDSVPITEDAALAPVNPYGRTKLAMERARETGRYFIIDYLKTVGGKPADSFQVEKPLGGAAGAL